MRVALEQKAAHHPEIIERQDTLLRLIYLSLRALTLQAVPEMAEALPQITPLTKDYLDDLLLFAERDYRIQRALRKFYNPKTKEPPTIAELLKEKD